MRFRTCVITAAALAVTAQSADGQHQGHHAADARGALVMGFSQTATSHHFRLSPSGGAVEVHVHDAADTAMRASVAEHLRTITKGFAAGNFDASKAVHGQEPPGVETLRARANRLTYTFEESERGGRVIIHTTDAEALRALHEFLRYQIREHKTGDSLNVLR